MKSEKLSKAFSELTPRQFEAIFLRFYMNQSYEQVAESMGITVKATYKLMARSLTELKNNYLPLLYILLLYRLV